MVHFPDAKGPLGETSQSYEITNRLSRLLIGVQFGSRRILQHLLYWFVVRRRFVWMKVRDHELSQILSRIGEKNPDAKD